MQNNEQLDKVLDLYYERYNKYNTEVLQMLGNVIKQFDGVTPSQAHIIAQELKYGFELNKLLRELSQISGKSIEDISKLFDKVAKENVEFSEVYFKAKNQEYVSYKDDMQLQDYVTSIKKQTNGLFTNLANSNNVGFVLKDDFGNATYKPLTKVYNDLIDKAVFNVSSGVTDYQSAMRNTIRQLADSGVRVHEEKLGYKNGYNRRIDSAVRQDILTGVRQINLDIQQEVGERFGADGVEISAHFPCAEDHLDIQGKQYTNEEFEKLNSELDRPIGEYNCRHFVFAIVMGVNEPSFSKNRLTRYKRYSQEKVEYEGKTYTKYEATQVQRQLETAVRKQKDRQIMARASGDKDEVRLAQQKISQLTTEYNKFSKVAGLDTYKNRMSVSGYHKVATK